jgi:tRNA(Ile)-lysidine synthase
MKEINPSVEEALVRTSAHLADAEQLYLRSVENIKKTLLKKNADETCHIPIRELLSETAPNTILYELLQPFGFTRQQTEDVFRSLSGESGKLFMAHKSGYRLLKDRTSLIIYQNSEKSDETFQINENDTDFDGIPPLHLSFRKVEITQTFEIDPSSSTATFDYDKIRFPLRLRKWRPGDRFIPFGMKGRKKVSDYFTERKYSILQKNNTWLLCSNNDIIWIIGERTDDRFRVEHHTKYALVINFIKKNCVE